MVAKMPKPCIGIILAKHVAKKATKLVIDVAIIFTDAFRKVKATLASKLSFIAGI